ncbi:MAG: hypothetical protein DCF15_09900 [Phormidesmis priestleyi]|uniref:Uncharacterized protein n=1 Tax=Phormidesmis priestleyi TaxID=268141 RepID=A0A2W4XEQ5_9CYAN|nr:MAG: hypothetical protein DCF15_09900 [Phormidesmis priestleyi]
MVKYSSKIFSFAKARFEGLVTFNSVQYLKLASQSTLAALAGRPFTSRLLANAHEQIVGLAKVPPIDK